MLNSGKKNRALHDKKNKYSNSRVVRKKNSEQFKSDDCILHAQIDLLNQYIRDYNRLFHVHSPSLSNDLMT